MGVVSVLILGVGSTILVVVIVDGCDVVGPDFTVVDAFVVSVVKDVVATDGLVTAPVAMVVEVADVGTGVTGDTGFVVAVVVVDVVGVVVGVVVVVVVVVVVAVGTGVVNG